ncbi:MAG: hypothetical protein NC399_07910, partial [Muribaculum sp.]|nr:hypothetical protein [Muribaculum sp.]
MRRFICFLLVAALGISLTACSTNNTNSESPLPDNTAYAESENANTDDVNTDNRNYTPSKEYDNVYPQHEPYGTGIGVMPGRVVWAHDPDSVEWDGNGYWWNPDNFDESVILTMVNDSIASLGGKTTAADGWTALFQAH